jgi:hypothetical protein
MAGSQQLVTYNGYSFNEYSDISFSATMADDDAARTTLYHRYKMRVETTIYAESTDSEGQAGSHFARIRDRLTKKGQALTIYHLGFHDAPFDVNVHPYGRRDVTFGPHPRVVTWEDIGHENAVHVVWECDFAVSACNRWSGIMSLNYQITTRIDVAGYTTRTISGYIEIAMTRINQRDIPDTADKYRNQITIPHLPNFHREHHWHLSLDKRRADFTIVDTEIRSPNPFAPGVINISGNHGVGWSRRQAAVLPQTIRASIELAQGQPRSRAWEIFKAIVESRLKFATAETVFLENLYCDESLFTNQFNFSLDYRTFIKPNESILTALAGMFTSTGIGAPLGLGTWQAWKTSIQALQSHRGQADLEHDPKKDQIIDLCSDTFLPEGPAEAPRLPRTPIPLSNTKLYNKKPPPKDSYIKYQTYLEAREDTPTTVQITVDPDDLKKESFDPEKPEANLGETETGTKVSRYVESQSGRIEFVWIGYAERVGYPIPRPDKLEIGGIKLTRVGRAQFRQKFIGNVLGQPVFAASWNQRYVVSQRPTRMTGISEWDELKK